MYRCHDRLLVHKQAVFDHLVGRWRDLFNSSFDVLLYDLTSTYFAATLSIPGSSIDFRLPRWRRYVSRPSPGLSHKMAMILQKAVISFVKLSTPRSAIATFGRARAYSNDP